MFCCTTILFCLGISVSKVSLSYFCFSTQNTKFHKTVDLGNEDLIRRQIALEPHTNWVRKSQRADYWRPGGTWRRPRTGCQCQWQQGDSLEMSIYLLRPGLRPLVTYRRTAMRLHQWWKWGRAGTRRQKMKAECTGGLEILEILETGVMWAYMGMWKWDKRSNDADLQEAESRDRCLHCLCTLWVGPPKINVGLRKRGRSWGAETYTFGSWKPDWGHEGMGKGTDIQTYKEKSWD